MLIMYVSLSIIVMLAAYLLWKARREYKVQGKLSIPTVVGAYVCYILYTVVVVFAAWHSFWPFPINKMVSIVIGFVFLFFGLWLYTAGKITLGSFKRESGLETNKLITSGIYQWSRNPMMVGWSLILLGIALIGRSAFAIILVALFWIMFRVTLVVEEEYLEQIFVEEYRKYCSRTPRYLGLPKSKEQ